MLYDTKKGPDEKSGPFSVNGKSYPSFFPELHRMPTTKSCFEKNQVFPGAIFLLTLTLIWICYQPGLKGSLHFDDETNLAGLANVKDVPSAIDFALSGTAGPLGRPLSLLTFAAQAHSWPQNTDSFLEINLAIHLINACLTALLLYHLALNAHLSPTRSAWIATASAGLWASLPILASSSLLIIQRMTTLSAFFSILTILLYLLARQRINNKPASALICMTALILIGTALSTLCKEVGLLLPTLILTLEKTILTPPQKIQRTFWGGWLFSFLILPSLGLLLYLVSRLNYPESTELMRGFSSYERLLTQLSIIPRYLRASFVPEAQLLGPFQDHFVAIKSFTPETAAIFILIITSIAAAVIFARRKPTISLAILWFFIGHALESTTIPLELYFEHRNYLPLIAPTYAVTKIFFSHQEGTLKTILPASHYLYTGLLLFSLFNHSTVWGDPRLAAEIWSIYSPNSLRAATYLAQQRQRGGELENSRRALEQFIKLNPHYSGLSITLIQIDCTTSPDTDHSRKISKTIEEFRSTHFSYLIPETLSWLFKNKYTAKCKGLSNENIYMLAEALLENHKFSANSNVVHNLNLVMAGISADQGNTSKTIEHLAQALNASARIETISMLAAYLNANKAHREALNLLINARDFQPETILSRITWSRRIEELISANKQEPSIQNPESN